MIKVQGIVCKYILAVHKQLSVIWHKAPPTNILLSDDGSYWTAMYHIQQKQKSDVK